MSRPRRGPFGLLGKGTTSFLVARSGAPLPVEGPVVAHGSMGGALPELARRGPALELRVLRGQTWHRDALWDRDTSDVVLVEGDSDEVTVVGATCIEAFSKEEIFEGWLQGLLLVSGDVQRAENSVQAGRLGSFGRLLKAWDGMRDSLAERSLVEARHFRTLPVTGLDLRSLFVRARAGDREANAALERVAFRERHLLLWRFARATREAKPALAAMYASRVAL